jgi:two-component system sensor histidine kinase QseC
MLNALALLLFTAGSLTLAAAAGLIAVMLRYCMVPLQALARQAERIDATSLESRFPAQDMPVELAPIVHRLNDLLARLENSFERERRFSADLAHELRTPIAGLRTTAEVALKYPEAPDPESFRSVLEIAQQMEAMVTRLLAQARSEQKAVPLQLQAVAVARLVEEVWHPLQKQAAARRLVTSFDIPPGAHIETDPTLLRGILLNLLANAVDYTPPGGTVRCAFRRRNGHFTLSVTNTVDNLEPADLPRLFERFWRKDTARSDAGHAGLGLSLAQSFAELLGLDLRAELNGGTELRLQLEGRKSSHGDPGPPSSRA